MKFGILQFPGSNCDQDIKHVLSDVLGHPADYLWHKEERIGSYDALIVPGGFSYGDYLRCGAIARFSPAMKAVCKAAAQGTPVIGICNGFQILCESGLLPGALVRNRDLRFICEFVHLRVESDESPFLSKTRKGQVLRIPIAHGEGCYFASPETLEELRRDNRILLRYCDKNGTVSAASNPNGALDNIAGICNAQRNVFGLMPHPERASEPSLGSSDGRLLFESLIDSLTAA
ncbi:MAG: phosphoribosylformylglycinamidine synthase subunit PurQ [Verrucomicrobiae bacterium]|nr:phosphoribosylformylglycinamidine synthase subunit PurQ [Verrucomicrobiae bacterium]